MDLKATHFTDVFFEKLGVKELWDFLADTRTAISLPVATPPLQGFQPSNLLPLHLPRLRRWIVLDLSFIPK